VFINHPAALATSDVNTQRYTFSVDAFQNISYNYPHSKYLQSWGKEEVVVICFNCSLETKSVLDQLITSGQYRNYSEAISVALGNLMLLQGELGAGEGAIVIGPEGGSRGRAGATTHAEEEASQAGAGLRGRQLRREDSASSSLLKADRVPELFVADNLNEPQFPLVTVPADDWSAGQEVPPNRWLWGQYNKLLPAKASCRALAHLLEGSPEGVVLETAALLVSEQAAVLGDYLAKHDEQNNLKRDEALSTAFPRTGNDAGKGRLRYANQFVASVNKQGRLSGLLADLKLIALVDSRDARLMLTEAGWHFATLDNPVLDRMQENPGQKFTRAEEDFLLEHICRSVPVEDSAYRTILKAVEQGTDTPDGLDILLTHKFSTGGADKSEGSSYLSTQRSGAVSRMADLGLMRRRRNGTRVSYVATEKGEQYTAQARAEEGRN
jgi:hypothetical protein